MNKILFLAVLMVNTTLAVKNVVSVPTETRHRTHTETRHRTHTETRRGIRVETAYNQQGNSGNSVTPLDQELAPAPILGEGVGNNSGLLSEFWNDVKFKEHVKEHVRWLDKKFGSESCAYNIDKTIHDPNSERAIEYKNNYERNTEKAIEFWIGMYKKMLSGSIEKGWKEKDWNEAKVKLFADAEHWINVCHDGSNVDRSQSVIKFRKDKHFWRSTAYLLCDLNMPIEDVKKFMPFSPSTVSSWEIFCEETANSWEIFWEKTASSWQIFREKLKTLVGCKKKSKQRSLMQR